jgi:hypothetical protein
MRSTDDRYRREQARFNLAMRLIEHEARTGTIRYLTGLHRRSPTRVAPLVRAPQRTLESGVFTNLLLANGLFCTERPPGPNLRANVDLGHRLCECFESFEELIPYHSLSFEWGWNLLQSIRRGDELGIARCGKCRVCYLFDLLSLPRTACPACLLFEREREVPFELMSA